MADEPQIPANESNPGIGNQEDDSDWEYEYHETETEVKSTIAPALIVPSEIFDLL